MPGPKLLNLMLSCTGHITSLLLPQFPHLENSVAQKTGDELGREGIHSRGLQKWPQNPLGIHGAQSSKLVTSGAGKGTLLVDVCLGTLTLVGRRLTSGVIFPWSTGTCQVLILVPTNI